MIFTAVVLFFLIGVVAIYALIQTGKNYALQAILIPIILIGTLYAGYAIYVLQGTPRSGIPEGEVELVFVEMQKPWIVFLAREKPQEGQEDKADPIPKYFRIVYNEANRKTMNELVKQMRMGQKVEGKFKAKTVVGGLEPPNGEFVFDDIRRENLAPKQSRSDDDLIIGIDPNVDSGITNRLLRNNINTPGVPRVGTPRATPPGYISPDPNQENPGIAPPLSPSSDADSYYPSWEDFPEF